MLLAFDKIFLKKTSLTTCGLRIQSKIGGTSFLGNFDKNNIILVGGLPGREIPGIRFTMVLFRLLRVDPYLRYTYTQS